MDGWMGKECKEGELLRRGLLFGVFRRVAGVRLVVFVFFFVCFVRSCV